MPEITPEQGQVIAKNLAALRQMDAEKQKAATAASQAAARAQQKRAAQTTALAAQVESGDVEEWRANFQRGYLSMLCEPKVMDAIRHTLTARDPKAVKDVLGVLLPALVAADQRANAPTKVTFMSGVPRPNQPAVAVRVES